MDKRYILRPGLLTSTLALAITLAACAGGSPVTLKYITPGGPDNCYLSAFEGELVVDPTAGLVFAVHNGSRWPVLWPKGWTARRSGSEIEVLYPGGTVFARTDTPISPDGGLNADGNWEMCGFEPIAK